MRIADAVWTATALLHRENPEKEDFEVGEIVSKAIKENLAGGFRPGLQPHASWHCVANKKPNGGRHRMLFETVRGRRRLVQPGDTFHPDRNGDIRPEKAEIPNAYRALVDWYDEVYSRQEPAANPVLEKSRQETINQQTAGKKLSPAAGNFHGQGVAFVGSAGAFVIPEQLRMELGIREGTRLSIYKEADRLVLQPITQEFIDRIGGSYKGKTSLVAAREREHRIER